MAPFPRGLVPSPRSPPAVRPGADVTEPLRPRHPWASQRAHRSCVGSRRGRAPHRERMAGPPVAASTKAGPRRSRQPPLGSPRRIVHNRHRRARLIAPALRPTGPKRGGSMRRPRRMSPPRCRGHLRCRDRATERPPLTARELSDHPCPPAPVGTARASDLVGSRKPGGEGSEWASWFHVKHPRAIPDGSAAGAGSARPVRDRFT